MKSRNEAQPCAGPAGTGHEWQPLFAPPLDAQQKARYMAQGHGDYMQCAQCGVITMRDGTSSCKPLALSQIFSDSKRREAALWNEKQQHPVAPQTVAPQTAAPHTAAPHTAAPRHAPPLERANSRNSRD
ncbi:MAG TPA: hypothetical protein VNA16_08150 [Abditibacteriaceae bacterium]|nr:hypothetical protein [Abditibacteriaceae bacterium]